MHFPGIRTAARHCIKLVRYVFRFGNINDEITQSAVTDHRGVVKKNGRAFSKTYLSILFTDSWCITGYSYINGKSDLRPGSRYARLGAAQSDFLLNGSDTVHGVWVIY